MDTQPQNANACGNKRCDHTFYIPQDIVIGRLIQAVDKTKKETKLDLEELIRRTIRDIPLSSTVKNLTSLTSNSTSNRTTHMGTYKRL